MTGHRCTGLKLYLNRRTKWGVRDTPFCPKCVGDIGDLMHMLWKCPKLFRYWKEVLDVISQVYTITVPRNPVVSLLSALDEETLTPSTHMAILRLLYVVRKLIEQFWIIPRVPTRRQWVERVNRLLIREKLTYQHRNAPLKFFAMWQAWLDVPGLALHQLIKDRLLQG